MLTQEDIQKIIKAQREVFATKEDFLSFKDEYKKDFSDMLTAVDGYAKKADGYFQKMLMLSNKVNCLEKWILQLAEKVGIQLQP